MLLPSGPANTRCSVCRFDPGNLHVQLSPAPGTGLQSPETGSQNRRYRDLSRQQRPHVPHLNPRKCLQIAGYLSETGKHRFASNCVVVDAARIEPVSISNSLLTGKLTGNFAVAIRWDFDAQSASQFNGLQPNSLRNGTGNFQT